MSKTINQSTFNVIREVVFIFDEHRPETITHLAKITGLTRHQVRRILNKFKEGF